MEMLRDALREVNAIAASQRAQPQQREVSSFNFDPIFMQDNRGKVDEKYEVVKRLGKGGYGTVSLVKCKSTGSERAMKAMELHTFQDPGRYELEINIAKKLDHPNVVRLFETFRDVRNIYLLMELCTGPELFDRIKDAPTGFDEHKAAEYIRQILAALCYLHAQCFAHRDIKPENLMLQDNTSNAALKVIDFGLACRFIEGTPMSGKVGTSYYVAPDVLTGKYDEKCDIWSVGIVSFALLCGRVPFSGKTQADTLKKVREGIVEFKSPIWDSVSTGAKDFVAHMLTKDPVKRPSAERLLQFTWLNEKDAPKQVVLPHDLMRRLQCFQAISKFKKIALTAVAQQLSDSDIGNLPMIFHSLDKNGDGSLSASEIKEGMQKQGMEVPKALEDILKSVDVDGSSEVNYTEFLAATLEEKLYLKRNICWRAFKVFDLNGDGKITREELSKVLNGSDVKNAIGDAKIDKIFREVENVDGEIDFDVFMKMMETLPVECKRRRIS